MHKSSILNAFCYYPIINVISYKWVAYETAEARNQEALEEIADAGQAQKVLYLHFLPIVMRPDSVALEAIDDKVGTTRIYSNTRDALRYHWDRMPTGNRNICAALEFKIAAIAPPPYS